MRYFAFAIVLMAWPIPAAAQQSFSLPSIVPALPSITPPLPSIAVPSEWRQRIPWEQPRTPAWEKRQVPVWEAGHVPRPRPDDDRNRRRRYGAHVVYVPYAVAVSQEPQIIVVQQPPVTRIVEVEVPAREQRVEETREPEPPLPPYVPSGDRTMYLIPGCYLGNVSPVNLKLPANCDIRKLATYVP